MNAVILVPIDVDKCLAQPEKLFFFKGRYHFNLFDFFFRQPLIKTFKTYFQKKFIKHAHLNRLKAGAAHTESTAKTDPRERAQHFQMRHALGGCREYAHFQQLLWETSQRHIIKKIMEIRGIREIREILIRVMMQMYMYYDGVHVPCFTLDSKLHFSIIIYFNRVNSKLI